MAAEFGVLPSAFIFGSEAMTERTAWHVAFDYAVWRQFAAAREKAIKSKNNSSRAARGQKMYSGDSLPDPVAFKRR